VGDISGVFFCLYVIVFSSSLDVHILVSYSTISTPFYSFFFFFFFLIMLDVVSFMYEKHRIIVDNLTLEILSPENEL
jgi:hypothetical protein